MQKKNLLRLVAILAFAGVSWASACAVEPVFADSPTEMQAVAPKVAVDQTEATPAPIPPLEVEQRLVDSDQYVAQLSRYALETMNRWTHAVSVVPTAPYEDVADDLAEAVATEVDDPGHCPAVIGSDHRRRCVWIADETKGSVLWNRDSAKVALLAGVGYWEGARYAANVDNCDCNSAAWRADPANAPLIHITGNCDGGRAWSIFQVWPRVGDASESPINVSCSKDMVAVRSTAARCALQILRMSMMGTGDLTGYTGESPMGDHPKATIRLEFARKALKKHPFTQTLTME